MNQEQKISLKFEASKKSVGIAYLGLIFLGWIGAHRFYADRKYGIVYIAIFFTNLVSLVAFPILGGPPFPILAPVLFVWMLLDAISIPRWIKEYNLELIENIK